MRVSGVEITLKIPVLIDKPDDNGITYTEDAIKKACENAEDLPIIQSNGKGEEIIIGKGTARYENQHIIVDGICRYGGTCERVEYEHFGSDIVKSMTFVSFGLSL